MGASTKKPEDLTEEAMSRVREYCVRDGEVREAEAENSHPAHSPAIDEYQDVRYNPEEKNDIETLSLPSHTSSCPNTDQRLELMQRVLQEADELGRDVFLLHRVDGWSYSQIAERFGITEDTVEKEIVKASLLLLEAVQTQDCEPAIDRVKRH